MANKRIYIYSNVSYHQSSPDIFQNLTSCFQLRASSLDIIWYIILIINTDVKIGDRIHFIKQYWVEII